MLAGLHVNGTRYYSKGQTCTQVTFSRFTRYVRMKKVDDRVDNPEYRRVFDASCFKVTEGNYLDEMLNWIEDFSNRIADAEGEQSKEELNLETKKLIDAGWIRPRGLLYDNHKDILLYL